MKGPVEVVCLGILVADVLARPVDAVGAFEGVGDLEATLSLTYGSV